MRESIQLLCKSTLPLGKMVDYIQEDVDSMNKELVNWKKEAIKYEGLLQQESSKTSTSLSPLENQLADIENGILDQVLFQFEISWKVGQDSIIESRNLSGKAITDKRFDAIRRTF